MIAEFAAGIAGLKTITELTALVLKMNVDAAVRQKAEESNFAIINAQNLMIELQSKHHELLGEKDQLEKRLVQMEDWKAQAANYDLTDVGGIFVYASKSQEDSPTPSHWLCANCYDSSRKSILQKTHVSHRGDQYNCFGCQTEFLISPYDH